MKKVKSKPVLILLIIICVVFAAGIAGSIFVLNAPQKRTVNIKRDGQVLYSLDLSRESDREIVIDYNGSSNTIEIKDGKIRVKSAECPDKTCVNMGWLESSAMPVVCLPNHLVIEFADGNSAVDAVSE